MQQSSNDKPIEMIDGNGKNVLNFAGGLVLLAALVVGGMISTRPCRDMWASVREAASSLRGRRVCLQDMRAADLSVVSGVVSAE